MRRYHITVGAKTTVDGTVRTGWEGSKINDQPMAREGDDVYCPECDSTGKIVLDGPRLNDRMEGRQAALEGDLCSCKCDPPPKLIANQTLRAQWIEVAAAPQARAATQPAATQPTAPSQTTPRNSGFAPRPSPNLDEASGLSCENLWRTYQRQAEAIVAPGGVLIADPKARNRAINAAYARLWLEDNRFQWAGLAAFASKQVGCGLLHAADSIENIQTEYESEQRRDESAKRAFFGLVGSPSEREKQAKLQEYEQRQRDYDEALRDSPIWGSKVRIGDDPLSIVQRAVLFVHDMLALGNTTLFLDVYPLHAFYKERGFSALKTCLSQRKDIYGNAQHPVLWPVAQETLRFGIGHEEILQAFIAIEAGNIAKSVELLAQHEQVNILQPVMYDSLLLDGALRSNHFVYVTGFLSGTTQAIELTLASQCKRIDFSRTIRFSDDRFADLSDIGQRMPFVLRAAEQFNSLLQDRNRYLIEQAIQDIAAGRGVR
ncbi:PAAR domain-containing protein [Pseudomonas mandelii]|uniref:PAAR domain-containing protein n=1 Tax=Pseudomonas mandelii TaxID=75612 RepID=UPI00224AFCAF|nr:PAAR domain-containing protein [Pseudomonas mandelii]MCX2901034.1 PAAR domain-containing protein [Pseudomonas mandelii]